MRKVLLLFILTFIFFSPFTNGQEFQLSIIGGINHVFEYGSEKDYSPGENDFPITPSHSAPCLGLGLSYFFIDSLGVELDSYYCPGSKVNLTDPSDDDSVAYRTGNHLALTLNLIYRYKMGNFSPYFIVGGGIDKLLAKDQFYTSAHGYEIEFTAPDKTLDLMADIGGGIHYLFRPNAGVMVDIRYMIIFAKPDNVTGMNLMVGAFIRF